MCLTAKSLTKHVFSCAAFLMTFHNKTPLTGRDIKERMTTIDRRLKEEKEKNPLQILGEAIPERHRMNDSLATGSIHFANYEPAALADFAVLGGQETPVVLPNNIPAVHGFRDTSNYLRSPLPVPRMVAGLL